MWVKKTEKEIQKEKVHRYIDIRKPLICFGVIFLVTSSLTWFSYERYPTPYFEILPFVEYLHEYIPFAAFLGIVAFVVGYIWNIKFSSYPFLDEKVICIECSKKRSSKFYLNCTCGGTFNKISEIKWVD